MEYYLSMIEIQTRGSRDGYCVEGEDRSLINPI